MLRTLLESYYPLCTSFGDPFKSAIEAKGQLILDIPKCVLTN